MLGMRIRGCVVDREKGEGGGKEKSGLLHGNGSGWRIVIDYGLWSWS